MTRALLFAGVLLLSAFSLQALSSEADLHKTIVLNEVVYNPRGPEVDGEWIELFNAGDSVNLQDWTITDQDNWIFQFPSLAVPQECYVVLHIGTGISDSDFSDQVAHIYANKSSSRLNNDGDDLLLQDSHGTAIDFFSYGSGTAVDYPPPELHWTGSTETVMEGYSSSVYPNGYHLDSNESWVQSQPSPGNSNGELSNTPTGVMISETYYNSYRDNEYVAIKNTSPSDVDISGWMLTDLEGHVAFPSGTWIAPQETFYITRNATSFSEDAFLEADFQYESGIATSMVVIDVIIQLNNDGDEVFLKDDHGRVIDAFIYGYSVYDEQGWDGEPASVLPKGRIAKREIGAGTLLDTDSKEDWESLREYGIGQSAFESELTDFNGSITAFSSPDGSFDVISNLIDGAEESIDLNLYEFTSGEIADHIISAVDRGVRIRILMEGSPVGGITDTQIGILDELSDKGVETTLLYGDESSGIYPRYAFNHGKYALVDGRCTLIGSENWGDSGFPVDNTRGNRGWGILIENREVHDYFLQVFESDWNPISRDTVRFEDIRTELSSTQAIEAGDLSYEYTGDFSSLSVTGDFRIRPVISPDSSLDESTVIEMIRSAREEILVEQFYIRPYWGNNKNVPNPYLEEVIEAARRGVQVLVLLDSSWYNVEHGDPYDNDDVVEYLNGLASTEGLPIEAKLADTDSHGLVKLHNKGAIVDGKSVLISSINWNKNSIASNREVGIIVHDSTISSFYRDVFMFDWKDDVTPPIAEVGSDRTAKTSEEILFDGSGSYDDVGIVNFSWDLDEDGEYDAFGPQLVLRYEEPGTHNITLKVEDAWENTDIDFCSVQVLPVGDVDSESNIGLDGIILMVVVMICVLVPATFFLRRTARKKI